MLSGAADRALAARHADTLASFNRDALRRYLTAHYRAPNMVVAAAGKVDHDAVLRDVERRFSSFATQAAPPPPRAHFGGGTRVVYRELEQAHMMLALEGVSITDPGNFNLEVFTNALGGGLSSRLFQEVREKRGLCYSISTFHWAYADTGLFGLYAGADAGDAPELMKIVVDEMNKAVARPHRGRGQPRQGADEGRPADGDGELFVARASARAPCLRLRPAAHHGGNGGADRRRHGRDRAAAGRSLLSRSRPSFAAIGAGAGLERAIDNIDGLVRLAA